MDECRSSTLDDVMRAVTMENIPFDFGAFLEMSPEGLDLLKGLLQRNPAKRITAKEAINHPWFKLHAAYEETSKENGGQVQLIFWHQHWCSVMQCSRGQHRQWTATLLQAACCMCGNIQGEGLSSSALLCRSAMTSSHFASTTEAWLVHAFCPSHTCCL